MYELECKLGQNIEVIQQLQSEIDAKDVKIRQLQDEIKVESKAKRKLAKKNTKLSESNFYY